MKRFKGFMRLILGHDQPEFIEFDATHYRAAGVPASTFAGMPILEAHELVNKWNSQQIAGQRFIYWLA